MKCEWILCPVCGSKTRNKIRKDTVLENYPLYCPKCRQESLSNLANYKFLRDKTYKTCTDIVG
ncbi:cysteine-rich KTR domain-containing protein [Streptococcus suis]